MPLFFYFELYGVSTVTQHKTSSLVRTVKRSSIVSMPADTVGKVSFHRFSYRGQLAAQVFVQIFKQPLRCSRSAATPGAPTQGRERLAMQSAKCIISGGATLHSAAPEQPMLSPASWNQNHWRKSGQAPFTQTRFTHTFRANHRQCWRPEYKGRRSLHTTKSVGVCLPGLPHASK